MKISRRRFLSVSAAFAVAPIGASAATWQGRAFGADVSMTIRGPREPAQAALKEAQDLIYKIEGQFNLFDANSPLSRLNANGALPRPSAHFLSLMDAASEAYQMTDGLFDPTVQRLWTATARGQQTNAAIKSIGWDRVRYDAQQVGLEKGQALTFNGIAQGYATDLLSKVLAKHRLSDVLVNIGEYRASGGPWRLGLQDPTYGSLGMRTLTEGAIATSSVQATPLGTDGHILHGSAKPQWSTVSVEAPSATLADSLSTAMILAPLDQIKAIQEASETTRITLIDQTGDLITL